MTKYFSHILVNRGGGIADFDKQAYKYDAILFWKHKAWINWRVFPGWKKIHTIQISADHHTEEDGYKEELLILKDNLDDKVQEQYQYMCREIYNTLCWYFHTEYTDELDPIGME